MGTKHTFEPFPCAVKIGTVGKVNIQILRLDGKCGTGEEEGRGPGCGIRKECVVSQDWHGMKMNIQLDDRQVNC